MKRCLYYFALTVLFTLASVLHVRAAPADIGVVLLHGKWGSPQSMQQIARALESAGYRVSNPEMAWSGRRLYDVDYAAALREVEAQAKSLRAQGAKRIVLAGQSLGANAVVAYASSGLDLDAMVLMAPGHFPETGMGKRLAASVDKARSMVAANRGADADSFEDLNQGRSRNIRMKAANYMSYFDSAGLGAMTKNIAKLQKPVPLLLLIGIQDGFYPESKAMFDSAPTHAASRYVALETDHMNMPASAAGEMLKWLDSAVQ